MSLSSLIIMIIFVVCVVFQVMTMLLLFRTSNDDAKVIDQDLALMDQEIRIAHADMSSRIDNLERNVTLLGLRAMHEDNGEWWSGRQYRLVVGNQPATKGCSCVHIRKYMQNGGR